VTDDPAQGVEEQEAQALGAGAVQLGRQADALEEAEQVVEQRIEAQPGGIGAEELGWAGPRWRSAVRGSCRR
jgi:hypothetical protein